jgi:shikimate dehydrogenase
VTGPAMRAAVLGSPIAHSLSPSLHRAAYAALGLDGWTYDAVECTVGQLPGLVAGLGPEWAGLSLTMPLKAAVLPLLDSAEPTVGRAAAANTLVLRDGGRHGANTDVPGLVAALAERAWAGRSATVLGAGATARSTLVSLADAGVREVDLAARRPDSVAALRDIAEREEVELRVHGWEAAPLLLAAPLVVSTVPAGAPDAFADRVPESPGTLLDVVYAPWPTALAAAWRSAGGTVVGGLDLLVHQAALQVRLMTGTDVAAGDLVPVLRQAGLAALGRTGG